MQDDSQALTEINVKIPEKENAGDREWLAGILAPRLAFQRSDKDRTVDDQVAYLQKVHSGGTRTSQKIESIEVLGNRAIVKCIVAEGGQNFHNLRLFVRRAEGWKLLAWANEPIQ